MNSIKTEEQFEQLVDSIQPEIIGVSPDRSHVRSYSQKMNQLIEYAKENTKDDKTEKERSDKVSE